MDNQTYFIKKFVYFIIRLKLKPSNELFKLGLFTLLSGLSWSEV